MTCAKCNTPITFGKPHYCSHGQPYSLEEAKTAEETCKHVWGPSRLEGFECCLTCGNVRKRTE